MLALTGPRIRRAMSPYDRRLEIDAPLLKKARRIFERTLAATPHQTRAELAEALAAKGIEASGHRLAHFVMHAELDALICSGPRRGKQFTYALVDQRECGFGGGDISGNQIGVGELAPHSRDHVEDVL